MSDFDERTQLRIIALEQAVIAGQGWGSDPTELAVGFYDFLTGVSDKPGLVLTPNLVTAEVDDSGRYTYWKSLNGVGRYRTLDGAGPEVIADFATDQGWRPSGWATWDKLYRSTGHAQERSS